MIENPRRQARLRKDYADAVGKVIAAYVTQDRDMHCAVMPLFEPFSGQPAGFAAEEEDVSITV